jgi:transcriptional regulator with GAF, ATPase, and Fis domain
VATITNGETLSEPRARSLHDTAVTPAGTAHSDELIKRALVAIRTHLGMDVAYVSQFESDRTILRVVDAPGREHMIKPGDWRPAEESYCRQILEGRLPQVIPDMAAEPVAAAMALTRAIPVGKHMGVPIRLPDGSTYGMFCCLGVEPDRSLRERDLQMLKAFADLAAFEITREVAAAELTNDKVRAFARRSRATRSRRCISRSGTSKARGCSASSVCRDFPPTRGVRRNAGSPKPPRSVLACGSSWPPRNVASQRSAGCRRTCTYQSTCRRRPSWTANSTR